MNELQIFNYNQNEIRTVMVDGEPWFVAADVCSYFGVTNRNRVMQQLDDDEKGGTQMDTPGGIQNVTIINEAGLYSLLFALQPNKARGVSDEYIQQRNEELRCFKRWVTHDVIPTIRKHGAYMTPAKIEEALLNPDTIINLAMQLKSEQEQKRLLTVEVERKDQIIGELQPKADYVDYILSSTGTMATTQIAADYGLSATKLNKILREERIQRKVGDQWILYKEHMGMGYTKSETIPITRSDGRPDTKLFTRWTQKGRLLINAVLNKRSIYAESW